MNNFTFGLTLLFVGMGGTMITIWLLTFIIRGLTALLPPVPCAAPITVKPASP